MNRGIKVLQTLALPLGYGTACLKIVLEYYAERNGFCQVAAYGFPYYNIRMRRIITIIRWEISRVMSDWKRAASVFIIPAAVLMIALNIFPYLINYMTTGSLSEKPVVIVDAPDSFLEYIEDTEGRTVYRYRFRSSEDLGLRYYERREFIDDIKSGTIWVSFDEENGVIWLSCNGNSTFSINRAESFSEVVLTPYNETLIENNERTFTVDDFNPITRTLNHRTDANYGAAKVIPAVLVLLIYYCVYSLCSDIFAAERERGFYDKLLMTPVSPVTIVTGKILACTILVTAASYVTFFFLFMSSWLNHTNSSTSLIPFGLFLLPQQVLVIAAVIPVTAFLCCAICVRIIFSIRRMKDIILNLQMPLIYLLADVFFQLAAETPGRVEFAIPIHGSTALIKAVFLSQYQSWQLITVLIVSLIASVWLLFRTFTKEGYIGVNR